MRLSNFERVGAVRLSYFAFASGLAYACFDNLSIDRQGNDISAVGCRLTVEVKIPYGTIFARQPDIIIIHVLTPEWWASSCSDQDSFHATPGRLGMFRSQCVFIMSCGKARRLCLSGFYGVRASDRCGLSQI